MSSIPSIIEAEVVRGEALLEMKDLGPCELVEGRIVPMSPTGGVHALVESKLTMHLTLFIETKKFGWVLNGEVGIYTRRNPDSVRAADIAFFSKRRLPEGPPKGFIEVAPELVVEIVSPSDSWPELRKKIDEYLAIGVNWVWVFDPTTKTAWIYRPDTEPQELKENDILKGEGILDRFELKISKLFEK